MHMKRTIVIISGSLVFTLAVGAFALRDGSIYLRLQRSMETFSEVFRHISMNYVDDVDPEAVVEAGIDGMLAKLDPYSDFIGPNDDDDVEMLSTGQYTGFGIAVARMDSVLVVTNVRTGQPAHRAGMRIGDRLLYIDDARVDSLSPSDLRAFTRGMPNTWSTVRVLRDGRSDTVALRVMRSDVEVENVAHAELMPDGNGYIKLSRFSRRATQDVRAAIADLRTQGMMRGLILDLRDNPGGLLDAAVGICEIFLPKGSMVVSTRGRDGQDTRTYKVNTEPQEPSLPLTVLINERSASASEIVAGAIQDHDRGVILGRRSFGKGLVQTVVSLSNDASLKMTTSRYYTPSGRSIQRVDHTKLLRRSDANPYATTGRFQTKAGRIVVEHNGIEPDTTVADSAFPVSIEHLVDEGVFFRFGTQFTSVIEALPSSFAVDQKVIDTFIRFVDSQPSGRRSPILADLVASRERAQREQWPMPTVKLIEAAEKAAERDVAKALRQHESLVRELLEQEIRSRFTDERVRIARSLRLDPVVKAASTILSSSRYSTFLSPGTTAEH